MTWDLVGNIGVVSYLLLLVIVLLARRQVSSYRGGTAVRVLEAIGGRPIAKS